MIDSRSQTKIERNMSAFSFQIYRRSRRRRATANDLPGIHHIGLRTCSYDYSYCQATISLDYGQCLKVLVCMALRLELTRCRRDSTRKTNQNPSRDTGTVVTSSNKDSPRVDDGMKAEYFPPWVEIWTLPVRVHARMVRRLFDPGHRDTSKAGSPRKTQYMKYGTGKKH